MVLLVPGGGVCDHPWVPGCARVARVVVTHGYWADDRVLWAIAEEGT